MAHGVSNGPVAIVVWGDVIEDYLRYLGLAFDELVERSSGGWLFGYVGALATQGVESIVVYLSSRFDDEVRLVHTASGASVVGLPTSPAFRSSRAFRNRLTDAAAPYLEPPVVRLARLLRRERCSALICQEYEYARFDVLVAVGRLLGIPVFGDFQGCEPSTARLERTVRPLAVRACTKLIVGSTREADRVRRAYGVDAAKVATVPNAVDTSAWQATDRASARHQLGIPGDAYVVAWHGRVEIAFKGLDVLLSAASRLVAATSGTPVRLVLVGTGADAADVRRTIDGAGLQDVVMWRNEFVLETAELVRWLSAADVYAFPSRREGFPMAPLEAMACGLPVVAADAPGVRDIFAAGEASGGIVVPCDDVDAFAAALQLLLADRPRRERLAMAARRRVDDAFSLDRVGEQLTALIRGTGRAGRRRS